MLSFVRADRSVAQTVFHRLHEFDVALVPRPPNSGGAQAAATQCFTVSLLLGKTVLLVLDDPTLLSFGMNGARTFCFERTANQVDDKAIQ